MAIGSDRPYLLVKCPTCKAKVGKRCKEVPGGLHPERMQKAMELRERSRRKHTEQGKSKSVYATPTAFESNRRRH
jgi:hypothetical protein